MKLTFIEQASDRPETCSRCAELKRETIIPAGERHWALITEDADADAPPRVVLCDLCRRFIRQAMTRPRRARKA